MSYAAVLNLCSFIFKGEYSEQRKKIVAQNEKLIGSMDAMKY